MGLFWPHHSDFKSLVEEVFLGSGAHGLQIDGSDPECTIIRRHCEWMWQDLIAGWKNSWHVTQWLQDQGYWTQNDAKDLTSYTLPIEQVFNFSSLFLWLLLLLLLLLLQIAGRSPWMELLLDGTSRWKTTTWWRTGATWALLFFLDGAISAVATGQSLVRSTDSMKQLQHKSHQLHMNPNIPGVWSDSGGQWYTRLKRWLGKAPTHRSSVHARHWSIGVDQLVILKIVELN